MVQKGIVSDRIFGGLLMKVGLVLAIVVILLAIIAFKPAGETDINVTTYPAVETIDVVGQATLYSEPDKATLLFGYEIQKETALESQQETAQVIANIKSALEAQGIDSDDIKTSTYSVELVRRWDESYRTYEIVGYETTHILKIETDQLGGDALESLGAYIDAAVGAGANRVDSIEFGLTDETRAFFEKEALTQAADDAQNKADRISDGLGVSVVRLHSASEGAVYRTTSTSYDYAVAESKAAGGVSTEITPGQVSVSATVSASFKFE